MVVPHSGTSGRGLVSRDRATSTRSDAVGFAGAADPTSVALTRDLEARRVALPSSWCSIVCVGHRTVP